jgi:UDP-glucose 4-epimerase
MNKFYYHVFGERSEINKKILSYCDGTSYKIKEDGVELKIKNAPESTHVVVLSHFYPFKYLRNYNNDLNSFFKQSIINLVNQTSIILDKKYSAFNIRIVYLSSAAVYGDVDIGREVECPIPSTIHGITKLICEKVIASQCNQKGIDYNILRLSNIYGSPHGNSIIDKIKCAIPIHKPPIQIFGSEHYPIDFLHINDLALILKFLCEADINEPIINVGSGLAVSLSSIINNLEDNGWSNYEVRNRDYEETQLGKLDTSLLFNTLRCSIKPRQVIDYLNINSK